MDGKFAKISPFQVDPDKIPQNIHLNDDDFLAAGEDEKASMVEKHKSVSYWKDAWRRFRKNTVSMAALFIFIVCLLFAFLGPKLIPYSYGDQYRSAQKLAPFEYSDDEKTAMSVAGSCDGFYATALQPGSRTAIKKGDYYVQSGGKTYAFSLKKAVEKSILILKADEEPALFVVKEKDIKDGQYDKDKIQALDCTDTPAEGASEIKLVKSVFPHVFGTDSAGRDIMARTMYGARVSILIGIVAALIVLVIGSIYGAISGLAGGASSDL